MYSCAAVQITLHLFCISSSVLKKNESDGSKQNDRLRGAFGIESLGPRVEAVGAPIYGIGPKEESLKTVPTLPNASRYN